MPQTHTRTHSKLLTMPFFSTAPFQIHFESWQWAIEHPLWGSLLWVPFRGHPHGHSQRGGGVSPVWNFQGLQPQWLSWPRHHCRLLSVITAVIESRLYRAFTCLWCLSGRNLSEGYNSHSPFDGIGDQQPSRGIDFLILILDVARYLPQNLKFNIES